jgi:argininosuccinate lyase
MKLWQKDYALDKRIENFTVGNDYILDQKLVKYDCVASIAHAKMLAKMKLISQAESVKLVNALNDIIRLDSSGKFRIKKDDEDCHTAIENFLVKKLGETGKKIHTARSRNDQVLTALRLYCKDEIANVVTAADELAKSLKAFRAKFGDVEMPGYTHTRKAMPSSAGLWAGAFIDALDDDKKLLLSIADITDQSPLGTAAGYGAPVAIDRAMTARLLGFGKVQENPIYAQNSRGKFESSILHGLGQVMFDLNKMACDIILFSMPEFGYFDLPPEVCTGSSIMPQKKNPDVLELVRAKYHQVISCEFKVKNISGDLISGYNRDLQLTKEPLFRGFDITSESLAVMSVVVNKMRVNAQNCKKAMTRELYATQKAYDLVKKGVPFRDAYKQVSKEFE